MYTDIPSRQLKVRVSDRRVVQPQWDEARLVEPALLQAAIDEAMRSVGGKARAFCRPSGTEDVVRIYAEAETRAQADALALEVAGAVHRIAGGIDDAPSAP